MADAAAITVRRQTLDVEVRGAESDGLALHRRLPRLCADVLAPAIESALAPHDPGGASLCVERVAIDITDVPLERFDADLAESIRREIAEWFRRNAPMSAGKAPETTADVGDVRWRSDAETVDEALVVFLRTGRLPWWFRVPVGTRLEDVVLDTWGAADATRGPPPGTRARLLQALALGRVRDRLVMQFTPAFAAIVLAAIAPKLAGTVEEARAALDETERAGPVGAAYVRRWHDLVYRAASAGAAPTAGEIARAAWRDSILLEAGGTTVAAVLERHWPGITERLAGRSLHDEVEPTPLPPSEHADAEPARVPAAHVEVERARPAWAQPARAHDEVARGRPPSPPAVATDEEVDEMLVDNAGVVLLHPFLPHYFEGLGVAAGDDLVDPLRAVCLVHHLATGELSIPEHQLTLAKVLCGVPLDEPVEAEVGFTRAEIDEAVALLDAAIADWEALRGTSPDVLRGEFLTRPGSLAVDGDGEWLLRVATRTVDILLDQLPWGISLIKLPWMGRLLRVEWR